MRISSKYPLRGSRLCRLPLSYSPHRPSTDAPEEPETRTPKPIDATLAVLKGVLNPGAQTESPQSGAYESLQEVSTECRGGSRAPFPAGISLGGEDEEISRPLERLAKSTHYMVFLFVVTPAAKKCWGRR